MSRLFASILIRSSKDSGRRNEIVFVDGLRFGIRTGRASLQSTYSLESCVCQNSRSSDSVLNAGASFLRFDIPSFLFSMHRPRRDHTNSGAFPAQGKGDMQKPLLKRLSQRVPTRFHLAMVPIFHHQQRLFEKHLLGLQLADPVLVRVLAGIAGVPSKTNDTMPLDHLYIIIIYILPQQRIPKLPCRLDAPDCLPSRPEMP